MKPLVKLPRLALPLGTPRRPRLTLSLILVIATLALALFIALSRPGLQHTGSYLWTAIGTYGLVFMGDTLMDALADRRFLREMGYNGRLRIVAHGHIRAARRRAVFIAGNVLLGIWSAYRREPLFADPFTVAAGFWLTLFELNLVVTTVQERADRRRAVEYPQSSKAAR